MYTHDLTREIVIVSRLKLPRLFWTEMSLRMKTNPYIKVDYCGIRITINNLHGFYNVSSF